MKITKEDFLEYENISLIVKADNTMYIGEITRNDSYNLNIRWKDVETKFEWYTDYPTTLVLAYVEASMWGFARNEKELMITALTLGELKI